MKKIHNYLFGMDIYISKYMTYRARRIATRTIKERLFSLPWRPFQKRKIVVIDAPMKCVIVDTKNDSCYVHPETYNKLIATDRR